MTINKTDSEDELEAQAWVSQLLTAARPRDPSWILEALGIDPPPPGAAEEASPPPMDREEIDELMRKLLHDELARYGLLDRE